MQIRALISPPQGNSTFTALVFSLMRIFQTLRWPPDLMCLYLQCVTVVYENAVSTYGEPVQKQRVMPCAFGENNTVRSKLLEKGLYLLMD